MKRLFLAVLVTMFLLISSIGFAATESLNFAWQQPNIATEYISGWVLYQSPTSGSGWVKVVDVPYTGPPTTEYTTSTILVVTGTPGTTVTKYFVLRAKSQGGQESADSNEVNKGFVIPYPIPSAPFQLKLTVTIVP
jgi:hypothetical protein